MLPALAAYFLLHALLIWGIGRVPWCAAMDPALWISDAWSSHTSQHLLDPYSFSHFQHGVIFFAALSLLRVQPRYSIWIALLIESAWELLENSPLIIDRYRTATAALDYYGDSVVNSVGDLLSALGGYLAASLLSWRITLLIYAALEIGMLIFIKDSLTLNVIMLIHPLDWIKTWQTS